MKTIFKIIINIQLLMLSLILSSFAISHATLETSTPENKSIIEIKFNSIELNFNKPMRLIKVSLTDQNGDVLKLKKIGKTFIKQHSIKIDDIKPALYTINWSSLGKDGHKMSGDFEFMYHMQDMAHDEALELFYQSFKPKIIE